MKRERSLESKSYGLERSARENEVSSPTLLEQKLWEATSRKRQGGRKTGWAAVGPATKRSPSSRAHRLPPALFPRDRPRRSRRQCSRRRRCWRRRLRHGRRHGRRAPADVPEEDTRHALTAAAARGRGQAEPCARSTAACAPSSSTRADSTFALTSPVRPRHFLTGDTCTRTLAAARPTFGKYLAKVERSSGGSGTIPSATGLWHGASRAHTHERFVRW